MTQLTLLSWGARGIKNAPRSAFESSFSQVLQAYSIKRPVHRQGEDVRLGSSPIWSYDLDQSEYITSEASSLRILGLLQVWLQRST